MEDLLRLGDSLLFRGLTWLVHGRLAPGEDVFLHPVALAGWFGLLVTGLNLIPIGQLDGGHVVYALLGRKWAGRTTTLALVGFVATTVLVYNYWFLFVALVAKFARSHPRPLDDATPLDRSRRAIGIATVALFALTFVPEPFVGVPPLWNVLRELVR